MSLLTNTAAMTALQTLRGINKNLNQVQDQISTGKEVGNAKDNAAIWAVAKTMESDVGGFKTIRDSLALGDSTVAVARTAAERTTDLLKDIKAKVVASQEENVNREAIQADIKELVNQVKATVDAAQFNGLNLVSGQEEIEILSSLDRTGTGVDASNITIARQDLTMTAGQVGDGASLDANATIVERTVNGADGSLGTGTADNSETIGSGHNVTIQMAALADAAAGTAPGTNSVSITVAGKTVSLTNTNAAGDGDLTATEVATDLAGKINALGIEGITAEVDDADGTDDAIKITSTVAFDETAVSLAFGGDGDALAVADVHFHDVDGTATTADFASATIAEMAETISFSKAATVNEGDGYTMTVAGKGYSYVAGRNETMEDVAKGLQSKLASSDSEYVTSKVAENTTTGEWELQINYDDGEGGTATLTTTGAAKGDTGVVSGGLDGLQDIDVTSDAGASNALNAIENMIENSIDAASALGSAQGRIEQQDDFMANLIDNFKSGIGSLVDADMEEASARLQALQVQQQLGVQALSIANQAPQTILSLFR